MKKLLCVMVSLMLLTGLLAACAGNAAAVSSSVSTAASGGAGSMEGEVFRVGVMSPMTGDMAFLGEGNVRLMEYISEEINSAGGINGAEVKFFLEDTMGTAAGATTAMRKLIDVDQVHAVIGPMFTSAMLAVKPTLNEEHIPAISPTTSNKDSFTENGYVFSIDLQPIITTRRQCTYFEDKGFETMAILGTYNDHTLDKIEMFNEEFPKVGGEVIATETFQPGSEQFRTELTKIKAANPDVIYMNVSATELIKIVREMQELGFEDYFIAVSHEAIQQDIFNVLGDLIDGKFAYDIPTPPPDSDTADLIADFEDTYVKWYNETYDTAPNSDNTLTYDCVQLLFQAARDAGSFDGEAIRDALYALQDVRCITGNITFQSDGSCEREPFIVEYVNGEEVYVKND